MVLSAGDTLTKANGETYVASAVSTLDGVHFNATLGWINQPPPVVVNEQQPFHVFAADGQCSPLKSLVALTRWNKAVVQTDPGFRLVFHAQSSEGLYLEIEFTQAGDFHTTSQRQYRNGQLIKDQLIQLPFVNDSGANLSRPIIDNEFVDFYSDGDSGQMFWYGPGAATQLFSYNFEPFDGTPTFTDVSLTVEPLNSGGSLNFSTLDVSVMELGQIANNTENGIPIPVQFVQEPKVSPCSPKLYSVPSTNVCMMDAALVPNGNFNGMTTSVSFVMTNVV